MRWSRSNIVSLAAAALLAFALLPARAAADPAAVLTAARAALEDGLNEVAAKQLESRLPALTAGSAEADETTVLLAQALYHQGRYRDMLARLADRGGKPRAGKYAGAIVYWRALARYELDDAAGALGEVQEFAVRYAGSPYVPRALRLQAWCHLKLGRAEAALDAFARFDQAYGTTPEGADNLLDWGKALLAAGRWTGAREVFERLLAKQPGAAAAQETRFWLARALIGEGKGDAAWNLLSVMAEDAATRADRRTEAWLALAELNAARTNFEAAAAAAAKGFELAPTPELKNRSQAMRGRLLLRQGKLE